MQHNHDGQRKGKHIKTCRSQVLNVNNPWCTDEDYKLLEPSGIRSLIHLIEFAMGNSFWFSMGDLWWCGLPQQNYPYVHVAVTLFKKALKLWEVKCILYTNRPICTDIHKHLTKGIIHPKWK